LRLSIRRRAKRRSRAAFGPHGRSNLVAIEIEQHEAVGLGVTPHHHVMERIGNAVDLQVRFVLIGPEPGQGLVDDVETEGGPCGGNALFLGVLPGTSTLLRTPASSMLRRVNSLGRSAPGRLVVRARPPVHRMSLS